MHTFLKPVIDSINDLYTKGKTSTVIQWTLQITDTLVHNRPCPLLGCH